MSGGGRKEGREERRGRGRQVAKKIDFQCMASPEGMNEQEQGSFRWTWDNLCGVTNNIEHRRYVL